MKISKTAQRLADGACVLLVVLLMYAFRIPCPFTGLFHIPCPGCGMTRAYMSLLHFDVASAFRYNPMFWSIPVLFGLYLIDCPSRTYALLKKGVSALILIGFLGLWIFRLMTL